MKKHFIPYSLIILLLSSACVDEKYDKDIDMNLQLAENGLTIPIGSTKQLKLADLIEEGDNLQTGDDHVYFVTDTTVASYEFKTMAAFDIAGGGLSPVMYSEISTSGIPEGIYVENIKVPVPLSVGKDITAFVENISQDIALIENVWFTNEQAYFATLTFKADLLRSGTSTMKAENLVIKFPEMLILSKENPGFAELGEGLTIENYTLVIPERYANADGVLELPRIPLYGIRGRDGAKEFLHVIKETAGEYHSLEILNNRFEIESGNILLTLNGNLEFTSPAQIVTEFSIETLSVTRIEGLVDARTDTEFTLEMGSLPEFLDNDDIELNLTNPYIVLEARNPMGVPVKAELTISTERASVPTDVIYIDGARYDEAAGELIPQINKIYIAKAPRSGMEGYTYVYADLPALLDDGIPSSIDVKIVAETVADEIHTIVLGENILNEVSVENVINVPLEFGSSLRINYSDIADGLEDTFKDFSFGEASIKIAYTSTLPLDVRFSIIPLQEIDKEEYDELFARDPESVIADLCDDDFDDEYNDEYGDDWAGDDDSDEGYYVYYKILRDVYVDIEGTMRGTADEGRPSTGTLHAQLGETVSGAMNSLTHIKWSVDGSAAAAEGKLRDTQYLQLDMKVGVKKIQINADSL